MIRDTLPPPPPSSPPPPQAPPPQAPGAEQTAGLLDRVIHQHVLECLDLEALHDLEQSLILTAGALDDIRPERAAEMARAIVDRALAQLADDARRYLRAVEFMACDGCALCEAEAREAEAEAQRSGNPGGSRRRPGSGRG